MSKYTDYIKSLPCCVSGYMGIEVEPHHVKGYSWLVGNAMGHKSSDLTQIPLRSDLHRELHDIGWNSFEQKYNINQIEKMVTTIIRAEREGVIKL